CEPALTEIRPPLPPPLATARVMGEPLDLLTEAITIEALHGLHDPDMEVTASAAEDAPVGHLMGERVLEGVLEIGEEARLVEKLGRLKMAQPPTDRPFLFVRHRHEEGQREVLPDDRGNLEEPLLFRWQAAEWRG